MKRFTQSGIYVLLFILGQFLSSCQESGAPVISEPLEDIRAIENGLKFPVAFEGEEDRSVNILDRMASLNVPGVSIAVFQNGKIAWARGYGYANTETKDTVDAETVFQAGSISKPLAALAALKLVEQGRVDLDENINNYLKDWKVPDNRFTEAEKVTLRRLLTHTAGLTVHGFPGYTYQDTMPSVIGVLDGRGNTSEIRVDTIPGSIWRYSGGGYTVMQKLGEDVSGQDFADFLQEEVLKPLGMKRSTYAQPLPDAFHANASAAFDEEGEMAEGLWNNYPEKAAAGLWTTPSDLVRYCIDIQNTMAGGQGKVIGAGMVKQMLSKDKNDWGLGPGLERSGDTLTFGHGGKNRGFSNLMTAFVHKGEGAIVMTNADNGRRLMGEIMAGISDHYGWDWYETKVYKKGSPSEKELKAMEGRYILRLAGNEIPVEITAKKDHLEIFDVWEDEHQLFYPAEDDQFLFPEKGIGIQILKNEKGEVMGLDYYDRGKYHFEKVS